MNSSNAKSKRKAGKELKTPDKVNLENESPTKQP
jgi:hypothetical protein